jgi:hypothetical protein
MLYTVKVFDSGVNLVMRGGVVPFETFKPAIIMEQRYMPQKLQTKKADLL